MRIFWKYDNIHIDFAPVVSISALSGQRTDKIFGLIDLIIASHRRRVSTGKLNQAFNRWTREHPPPSGRTGRRPNLLYATQASVAPPQFVIFASRAKNLPEAQYSRFIENRLRKEFDFEGTAVRVSFRKRMLKKGSGGARRGRGEKPKGRPFRQKR